MTVPTLSIAFSLLLLACGKGTEEAPVEVEVGPTVVETVEAEPEEAAPSLEVAHSLMNAGSHGEAIAMLQGLLAEEAGNIEIWKKLLRAGLASGTPADLLDQLDAGTAIGDQTVSHFRLRAELALAADRPADAVESARKIQEAEPEIAAALLARAILNHSGTEPLVDTSALDPKSHTDALVLAANSSGSRRARHLAKMEYVHWQARLVHADLLVSVKQKDKAISTWTDLVDRAANGSRASYQSSLALAEHLDDQTVVAGHYAAAAEAAATFPDGAAVVAHLEASVDAWLEALEPEAALELARAVHQERVEAQDAVQVPKSGMILARSAFAAGHMKESMEHAKASSVAAAEAGHTDLAYAAAWLQGMAAWRLRDSGGLTDAAARCGERGALLEAMTTALTGDTEQPAAILAASKLRGTDGVEVQLAAAAVTWMQGGDAAAVAGKAVKLADKAGHQPSRLETRLVQEGYARRAGSASAASVRRELESMAAALGEDGVNLQAEVAARRTLAGEAARFPEEDAFLAWRVLVGAAEAPVAEAASAEGEESAPPAATHPILLWAQARQEVAAGGIDEAIASYVSAIDASTANRVGPWASPSVLTGHDGPGLDPDLKALAKSNHPNAGLAALAVHDWWHQRRALEAGFSMGDDPSDALDSDGRIALADAHQQLRAATNTWLLGGEAPPADLTTALDAAHKTSEETPAFARALPLGTMDYGTLRLELGGHAILSYRLGNAAGDAIVITKDGTRVVQLSNPGQIAAAAVEFRRQLLKGKAHGGSAVAPTSGDLLRKELVSVFHKDLSRIGRYLVIPDGPLWGFSFNALPEQQDGRRFLADIRSLSSHLSTTDAFRELASRPVLFSPDFLGLAPGTEAATIRADGLKVLGEMVNASRQFGQGLRITESGDSATRKIFLEKASKARYIHISDYGVGNAGDLLLAGGSVSLAEIRAMNLSAQVVVLSANGDPLVMLRQAQAFHSAGALNLVVSSWLVEAPVRGKYLYNFYEARNRERSPGRSLAEARQAMQSGINSEEHFDPSWWGQFNLYGRP